MPAVQNASAVSVLSAAVNALQAVGPSDTALSLSNKVAELQALAAALLGGLDAIRRNTYLLAIQGDVAALQAAAGPLLSYTLPAASAQLGALDNSWTAAQPCMDELLARVSRINNSVLVLPDPMGQSVALLEGAAVALDALLATNVTGQLGTATLAASGALAQLEGAKAQVDAIFAALGSLPANLTSQAATMGAAASALSNASVPLASLQSLLAAYTGLPTQAAYDAARAAAAAAVSDVAPPRDLLAAVLADSGASLLLGTVRRGG